MKYVIFITILFTQVQVSAARDKVTEKQCKKVQAKIDKIDSHLRQPYTVTKGEKLKAKQRDLKKIRYQCKKARLSTK